MAGQVPRSPAEITPDWLDRSLHARGVISAARVTGVEAQSLGVGVGFLGQVARLKISYDRTEPGAPATAIVKMPTLDPGGREICRIFQFYEREIRFYEEIASKISMRVPRCYDTAMDIKADDYLILLEEMTDVAVGDEVAGCTPAEAEQAIRALAQFHATWWENPDLDKLDWMPPVNAPVQHSAEQSYNEALPHYLKMFGDRLSPAMRRVTEDMRTHVIDLLNLLEPAPRTILHGDYRLDNVFFGPGGAIAAIDWQISTRGRGIFDVAYFASSGLAPAERKASEMGLLRIWYDIVTDGGAKSKQYTFDAALEDYRRATLFCNVYTVIGVGSLDPANERGMALFDAWIERRNTAIEDLNAGELMPR